MLNNGCPFTQAKHYEVLKNLEGLGHVFNAGEVVVFRSCAYDAKGGVTRFWFDKEGDAHATVWHVWDDDPLASEQWVMYFNSLT